MIRELKWVSLLAAGVLTFAGAAFAMGSGGSGGGMEAPSVSAPSYDPAEEYAKGLDALQAAKYRCSTSIRLSFCSLVLTKRLRSMKLNPAS